jgi:hypothetical protein
VLDEGTEVAEFAAEGEAQAVVDEEGDLCSAGRELGQAGELGVAVIDLDGDVGDIGADLVFGFDVDQSLSGGGTFLLGR